MNQFETLRQDLHENYGHEYTAAEIDAKLDEVIAKHTKKAELEEFVPLLVEREVRDVHGRRCQSAVSSVPLARVA